MGLWIDHLFIRINDEKKGGKCRRRKSKKRRLVSFIVVHLFICGVKSLIKTTSAKMRWLEANLVKWAFRIILMSLWHSLMSNKCHTSHYTTIVSQQPQLAHTHARAHITMGPSRNQKTARRYKPHTNRTTMISVYFVSSAAARNPSTPHHACVRRTSVWVRMFEWKHHKNWEKCEQLIYTRLHSIW